MKKNITYILLLLTLMIFPINGIFAYRRANTDEYKEFLRGFLEGKYYINKDEEVETGPSTMSKTGKEVVDKLNEIALTEAEDPHEGGYKYWSWFGFSYRDEWCAMFVSWLFTQVDGIDKYIIKSAAATYIARYSTQNGYSTWHEDECTDPSTVPQPGDVILFDPWENGAYTPYPHHWNEKFYSSHIGYVYDVDDTYVYTVEGNSGDRLRKKQYDRKTHCGNIGSQQGINGYLRPNY